MQCWSWINERFYLSAGTVDIQSNRAVNASHKQWTNRRDDIRTHIMYFSAWMGLGWSLDVSLFIIFCCATTNSYADRRPPKPEATCRIFWKILGTTQRKHLYQRSNSVQETVRSQTIQPQLIVHFADLYKEWPCSYLTCLSVGIGAYA